MLAHRNRLIRPYQPRIDSRALERAQITHDEAERLIHHENCGHFVQMCRLDGTEALNMASDIMRSRHALGAVRADQDEGVFSERTLTQIKQRPFEVKYPQFLADWLVPVDTEGDTGAEHIGYDLYDYAQEAAILNSESDDYPLSEITKKQGVLPVVTLGTSYEVNIQEIRRAALAARSPLQSSGASIVERKTASCLKAMKSVVESIVAKGDVTTGLKGFYNDTNWPTVAFAANSSASNTNWALKEAKHIIADVQMLINAILNEEVFVPNVLAMPRRLASILRSTPYTGGDYPANKTVWDFIKNSCYADYDIELVGYNRLNNGADGSFANQDIVLCYDKDPVNMVQVITQPVEIIGPYVVDGTKTRVKFRERHGGVHFRYPSAGRKAAVSRAT